MIDNVDEKKGDIILDSLENKVEDINTAKLDPVNLVSSLNMPSTELSKVIETSTNNIPPNDKKNGVYKILRIRPTLQKPGYCGPASLRSVLLKYGVKKYSMEHLAKMLGATEDGCDEEDIVRVGNELGYKSYLKINATIDDLQENVKKGIPPIICWKPAGIVDGHFSIYCGIEKNNRVVIADPLYKLLRRMSDKEFYLSWYVFNNETISNETLRLRPMVIVEPK